MNRKPGGQFLQVQNNKSRQSFVSNNNSSRGGGGGGGGGGSGNRRPYQGGGQGKKGGGKKWKKANRYSGQKQKKFAGQQVSQFIGNNQSRGGGGSGGGGQRQGQGGGKGKGGGGGGYQKGSKAKSGGKGKGGKGKGKKGRGKQGPKKYRDDLSQLLFEMSKLVTWHMPSGSALELKKRFDENLEMSKNVSVESAVEFTVLNYYDTLKKVENEIKGLIRSQMDNKSDKISQQHLKNANDLMQKGQFQEAAKLFDLVSFGCDFKLKFDQKFFLFLLGLALRRSSCQCIHSRQAG